jgi:hypothetical protein
VLAQDARTVLAGASKAMGAENLKTIQYSGMGSIGAIGQSKNPRSAWPLTRLKSYSREIALEDAASQSLEDWITPLGFVKAGLNSNATLSSQTIDETRYNVVSYTLQNRYRLSGFINEQNLIEKVQTWIDNDVPCSSKRTTACTKILAA